MNPLVSIIIVNWNGKHHLEKCLPSLKEIDYPNYEVVLVDNGSSDGSVEYAKKEYPHVVIVQNTTNRGFAAANNDGYALAKGDYILFLNNDTIVEKDFLSILTHKMQSDPTIGGLQPRIMMMDDHNRYDSVGSFITFTGFLYHYGYLQKDEPKYHKDLNLYTAKGACMLFRKSIIDQIGLFDSEFFAYFEETDFCHRVWLVGYSIKYVPQATIYHKGGGTSKGMNSAFIQFHSFKNRINSYIKNLSPIEMLKILPLHIAFCELTALAFLAQGHLNLFIALNKSIWWNIVHLPRTLQNRLKIQSMRKIPDAQLFKNLKKRPPVMYYYHLFANTLETYNDQTIIT